MGSSECQARQIYGPIWQEERKTGERSGGRKERETRKSHSSALIDDVRPPNREVAITPTATPPVNIFQTISEKLSDHFFSLSCQWTFPIFPPAPDDFLRRCPPRRYMGKHSAGWLIGPRRPRPFPGLFYVNLLNAAAFQDEPAALIRVAERAGPPATTRRLGCYISASSNCPAPFLTSISICQFLYRKVSQQRSAGG